MSEKIMIKAEARGTFHAEIYHLEGTEGGHWYLIHNGAPYKLFHVGDRYADKGIRLKDFVGNEIAYLDHDNKVHMTNEIRHVYRFIQNPEPELLARNDVLVSVEGELMRGPIKDPITKKYHVYKMI